MTLATRNGGMIPSHPARALPLCAGEGQAFPNLNGLMERPDVTELVNACDAGREGELIFRLGL